VSPLVKLASVVLTGAIALLRGPVFIFIDPVVVISTAQTFEPAVSTALMALRMSSRTGLRSVLPPLGLVFREGTAMPCHQPILKARHTCHSVQLHRNTVHSVVAAAAQIHAAGDMESVLIVPADVRFWHKADMPSCTAHVRFWG
jgi:hypothetical protein